MPVRHLLQQCHEIGGLDAGRLALDEAPGVSGSRAGSSESAAAFRRLSARSRARRLAAAVIPSRWLDRSALPSETMANTAAASTATFAAVKAARRPGLTLSMLVALRRRHARGAQRRGDREALLLPVLRPHHRRGEDGPRRSSANLRSRESGRSPMTSIRRSAGCFRIPSSPSGARIRKDPRDVVPDMQDSGCAAQFREPDEGVVHLVERALVLVGSVALPLASAMSSSIREEERA